MFRSFSWLMVTASLFGCQSMRAESTPAAASAAAPVAKMHVGTDPGHAAQGAALAPKAGHDLAAFAAGCFWGVEDAFRKVPGVTATAVGYTGGHTQNPTYATVCDHDTGHAETVLVEFDPKRVTFETLTRVFFEIHDPTTLNRQGPDVGDQYRSAVFTFSSVQAKTVREVAARVQKKMGEPVVTEIKPIGAFYKAEDYHQQYAERTGTHGCPVPGFNGKI